MISGTEEIKSMVHAARIKKWWEAMYQIPCRHFLQQGAQTRDSASTFTRESPTSMSTPFPRQRLHQNTLSLSQDILISASPAHVQTGPKFDTSSRKKRRWNNNQIHRKISIPSKHSFSFAPHPLLSPYRPKTKKCRESRCLFRNPATRTPQHMQASFYSQT